MMYIGEDCMRMFCESLREHGIKIVNFEKKKMIPLTSEECKSYLNEINKSSSNINTLMIKIILKLKTIVIKI